jgi:putative cell wall-binding protein
MKKKILHQQKRRFAMRFKKALSLALSVWITGALLLTAPVKAATSVTVNRIMGNDRYLTAIAIVQKGWPYGAETVVITTGENFPDALSAAPLAKKYSAPILLTESDRLASRTLTELKRLNAKKAYIIGGTGVISEIVDKQLAIAGITPVRLAGQDRFETSMLVAKEVGVTKGIFVTGGADFRDALAAAPIAAAKSMPVLLVPPDDLTEAQKEFLDKSKIPATYVVNDLNWRTVSEQVIDQLPEPEIISGGTAYERNVNLLERFLLDLDLSALYVATGNNFPDALAASALAAKDQCGIIMLEDTIPSPVSLFLENKAVGAFNILGGYGAIAQIMEERLKLLPAQIMSVGDLAQTIQSKQKYTLPETVIATLDNGALTEVRVAWGLVEVDTARLGTSYYEGTVKGYDKKVGLTLTVTAAETFTINPITAEAVLGGSYTLPKTVKAVKNDNTIQTLSVSWSSAAAATIPSKTGTFTYQGTVEGLAQKVKLTLKVIADAKITLKDRSLDQYVRNFAGKTTSDTLYKSDVLGIVYLDLNGNSIQDLSGIENFTNLKVLNLGYNLISKVTALAKLTNLESLSLNNNQITDPASLKSLTNLEVLSLKYNSIKDFSSLKTLTRLNQLYLQYNATTDYAPLAPIYNNLMAKDFELKLK